MTDVAHLQIVVLAAGASTRLGSPKQLAQIAGRPALQRAIAAATAVAGNSVAVVLGSHAADITRLLQHSSASQLINRQWSEGVASSIRCGIQHLPPSCEAVLLMLGDQVAVTSADIKRLVDAWNGQDSVIVASTYSGQVGVPAIFPRFAFNDLMQLRGDQGAKALLNRYASRVTHVPMPNAAYDLDTPEDLAAVQEVFKNRPQDTLL